MSENTTIKAVTLPTTTPDEEYEWNGKKFNSVEDLVYAINMAKYEDGSDSFIG